MTEDLSLLLSAYHDDELTPGEKIRAETELEASEEARALLAKFRDLHAMVQRATDPLQEARIAAAMDRTVRAARRRRWAWRLSALAAAAVVLLFVWIARPQSTVVRGGADGVRLELADAALQVGPGGRVRLDKPVGFGEPTITLEDGALVIETTDTAARVSVPGGSVTVEPDSEVELRWTQDGVEVDVRRGRAVLERDGERQVLEPNEPSQAPPGEDETGAAPPPEPPPEDDEPEVARVDPAESLKYLLLVRDAGKSITEQQVLPNPNFGLALLTLGEEDENRAAVILLSISDPESRPDRLGLRKLLGDVASSADLSAKTREQLEERFLAESTRADPLERRLAIRGLAALIPETGDVDPDRLRSLERILETDPSALLRVEGLRTLAVRRPQAPETRALLERATQAPDGDQVSAAAKTLLDRLETLAQDHLRRQQER